MIPKPPTCGCPCIQDIPLSLLSNQSSIGPTNRSLNFRERERESLIALLTSKCEFIRRNEQKLIKHFSRFSFWKGLDPLDDTITWIKKVVKCLIRLRMTWNKLEGNGSAKESHIPPKWKMLAREELRLIMENNFVLANATFCVKFGGVNAESFLSFWNPLFVQLQV